VIKIKKIGLKNFFSFGECWNWLELDQPGVTLILGENADLPEIDSRNGVGKTSIYQAISVALYNSSLTFIKKDNWINSTNKQGMEVVVEFEKDAVEYKIHRGRKPDFVMLYRKTSFEDWDKDLHDITPDSIANTNTKIVEILGIKFDLFRYVVLFTATNIPFLDLPAPDQRAIVERLFDMDIITEKAIEATDRKRDLKNDKDIEEYKYKAAKKNNDRIQETIKNAEAREGEWEQEKEIGISSIEKKLNLIEGINFEVEAELHQNLKNFTFNVQTFEIEKEEAQKELIALNKEIEMLEDHLKHLHDDKCPFCLQQMPTAAEKIVEINETIDNRIKGAEELGLNYISVKKALAKNKELLSKVTTQISHESLVELMEIKNQSDNLRLKIEELKNSLNPHLETIQELKKSGIQKLDSSKIDKIKLEFDHTNFLLKLLNDKNSFIRRRIIGQVLPFMNSRLKHYLKALGLPHRVEFENNLMVTITQYGRELSFGNLSSGEKQRVNLALSFTFREVLSAMHTKFNILLLDEVLDAGLDAVGVDNTVKILKKKGRDEKTAIFLISHREEVSARVDRTVIVRKEGGFSSIVENEED